MTTHCDLVVGLGNPGIKYVGTRHNVGFQVLHSLINAIEDKKEVNKISHFKKWRILKGFSTGINGLDGGSSDQATIEVEAERASQESSKILLLKPLSYMNKSGYAVAELVNFYKIPISRILVVHDELDFEFGRIGLKKGGSDGGHNGIKSIISCLGTDDFARMRIGIGRPKGAKEVQLEQVDTKFKSQQGAQIFEGSVADWVLARFLKEDFALLERIVSRAVELIEVFCHYGLTKAQNLAAK